MKIFYILIILLFLNFSSSIAVAETKQDCSIYNYDSLIGMLDKRRCEQGKPPRKKFNIGEKLKKLNPLDKN